MTSQDLLIARIKQLSEEEISTLLNATSVMLEKHGASSKPDCPYCGSQNIIRYGHKCNKQRFLCRDCGRTFTTTTHTVMSHSHFPPEVWAEVIEDTLCGNSIDYTARRLGLYHQATFDMRHKILMALQQMPETGNICLGEVSELDETFVLDCYKGKPLDGDISRKPRKHGAKAEKRGISSEYICICSGIQRNGAAYAAAVNRAKPDAEELRAVFTGHIADATLILCDGLRSYHILPTIADCAVKDCSKMAEDEKCFYHLNTVNGFHSFIKSRYHFYRGVATKYLNRYNTLFSAAYRNVASLIKQVRQALLEVGRINYYHSNKAAGEVDLLAI